MDEPLIDVDDLQGHIWPGFGPNNDAVLLALSTTPDALRALLDVLLPSVTTAREALCLRAARKAKLQNGSCIQGEKSAGGVDDADPLRVAVALTRQGLDRAGMNGDRGVDSAFDSGMTGFGTGDPKKEYLADGAPERAHPRNWVVGGPNHPFDVLLMFIARHDVVARCKHLEDRIVALPGVTLVRRDVGEDLPYSREHFGFQDGISGPGLYGAYDHEWCGRIPITTRYGVPPVGGTDFGKPGQPLVWPGRFIVGLPASSGTRPPAEPAALWKNGSFLVYRRLAQDVPAFYADTDTMAARLAAKIPGITGAQVRNHIVGRTPEGRSLMRLDAGAETALSINHFFYATPTPRLQLKEGSVEGVAKADVTGTTCPFWAHVRKVNPRDGLNDLPEETKNLQLLRRGIPFGPKYEPDNVNAASDTSERGLLFLSYQRDIGGQFEKLNSHWMNQFDTPAGGGYDLLVGQALDGDGALTEKRADWPGTTERLVTPHNWVRATGGAYLFAPSLATLRRLAAPDR